MKFKVLVFLSFFVMITHTGCGDKEKIDDSILAKDGGKEVVKEKQTFNLTTVDGKALTLNIDLTKSKPIFKFDGLDEKVVLLNFFATWCPPCKAEIPHLNNLKKKYPNDFEVIAVLVEENKPNIEVKSFMLENEIDYILLNSPENFALASAMGGVKSIPTMFMIAKSGIIIEKYVGATPEEMLENDIKRGLKE